MANNKKEEKKPIGKPIDYSITHREMKFSDLVKLSVKEDAFLLSFTQKHPENDNAICIAEIVLPPKVAASLGSILMAHALRYQEVYERRIMPKSVVVEEKKTGNEPEPKA